MRAVIVGRLEAAEGRTARRGRVGKLTQRRDHSPACRRSPPSIAVIEPALAAQRIRLRRCSVPRETAAERAMVGHEGRRLENGRDAMGRRRGDTTDHRTRSAPVRVLHEREPVCRPARESVRPTATTPYAVPHHHLRSGRPRTGRYLHARQRVSRETQIMPRPAVARHAVVPPCVPPPCGHPAARLVRLASAQQTPSPGNKNVTPVGTRPSWAFARSAGRAHSLPAHQSGYFLDTA